jgi:DNA-binding MarR family transcriptional regulator
VKKVKNRKDRRVTHVFITDAGKEALVPVEPIINFYSENFLKDISEEEYETAKNVLKTLIRNIKAVENY